MIQFIFIIDFLSLFEKNSLNKIDDKYISNAWERKWSRQLLGLTKIERLSNRRVSIKPIGVNY